MKEKDKNKELMDSLLKASEKIHTSTIRGNANWIVTSTAFATEFERLNEEEERKEKLKERKEKINKLLNKNQKND